MLLGLDIGTTNVKAVLVEEDGRVVARGSAPVRLIHVENGGVEQDIDEIFSATLGAIAQAGSSADLSAVEAVGVSSQGGALQILDESGRPLGRAISWLDARGDRHSERITREIGSAELARRTGHSRGTMALGQLLRLREERAELLAGHNRISFVGDVIVSRLCGRRAHDATSLSCAVLLNPSTGSVDQDMIERLGIIEAQLPELLSAREPAGGLLEAMARRTSLPAGIPVSPAVHDQYAAALGVGATAAGDVMFGAGTAWVLLAVSDRLMKPAAGAGFVCTHVVEGLYGQILSMVNGGSAVSWAMELTGLGGVSHEGIDDMLESVQAGSDGLRFWPLLVPAGGAGVARGMPGRLAGLRLLHGRAHVLRAVVEGLAMELVRYLGLLSDVGAAAERIIMCGGAAASRVTPQIIADATGLPVECAAESDTSALGAAMIGRGLLEPGTALASISERMVPPARLLEPGPNAGLYQGIAEQYAASLPMQRAERR